MKDTTEQTNFDSVVGAIHSSLKGGQGGQGAYKANPELGQAVMRLEGFRGGDGKNANALRMNAMGTVDEHLKSLQAVMAQGSAQLALDEDGKPRQTVKTGLRLRSEQRVSDAAANAFALANNTAEWADRTLLPSNKASSKGESVMAMSQGMSGGRVTPSLRMEAFNDVDMHATMAFSMGAGASITRMTDFVMGWYPPIVISPDQTALEVKLVLQTIFNGAVHDTETGDITRFSRRNPARAFEDPSLLNRHATWAIPIHTAGTAKHFVDSAVFQPRDYKYGNRTIHSSFLKYDNDFNILGVGTPGHIVDTQGNPTHRESIEPGTKMESLLIKCGPDVIVLPVLNLRSMNFIGAQQWDQAENDLKAKVTLGLSGSKLKTHDDKDLTGPLKVLADNKLIVAIAVQMSGSLNTETANANVGRPTMRVVNVQSAETGETLAPDSATYKSVVDAFAQVSQEGYRFRPIKSNSTKREQGDRLNTRRFAFQYMVPYRDPVSVERQVDRKSDHEAADLTALMGLLKIRIENEAVDHMFEMFDIMAAYVDMQANDATINDLPGLAQFWNIPVFHQEKLELNKMVDSQKSSEKAEDIAAALCLKIRDVATRLLTFSQWKAAMIMQNNDTLPPPQINLATSPIIARYLFTAGDMRTFGDYDYIITTTLNRRLADKIALSFRIPGSENSNSINVFNWGHLVTAPELVFAANMIRNSDYYCELQMQPRYDFLPMNLTGALFTVSGIPEVLGKIEGYSRIVAPLTTTTEIVDASGNNINP